VACNPILRIRRNGAIVTQFDLGQFEFALDKLKEIYLAYNNDGEDADIWKRYSQEALYDGEALQGVDIWCTYLHNQVLNFTFTDDKGAWEMILLTIAEGVCSPHAVDTEYDEEDEEYKDVSSFYHVYCPIVCYTLRIKSTGAIEVLQHWLVINKNVNNGIANQEWANAQSAPVEEINEKDFPTILIDCGNGCRIATDFRNQLEGEINGKPLPFRLSSNKICGYFETTNPDKSVMAEGSVNSYRRERVSNGNVEIKDKPRIGLWCTDDAYAFCEDIDMGCAQLVAGTFSYYGRLSAWKLDNSKLVYSLLGNVCRVFTDSPDPEAVQYETLSNYCSNINLEYLPSVRRATRNLKDFNQFVADVTSGKINS
jgi:hypothetical protein